MTDVELTEQALGQLDDLDAQVADRVLNKVEEATEWTSTPSNRSLGIRTTSCVPVTIGRLSRGTARIMSSAWRQSATGGTFTVYYAYASLQYRFRGT